jgi:hypothetical protein
MRRKGIVNAFNTFWTWCNEHRAISIPLAALVVGILFGLML